MTPVNPYANPHADKMARHTFLTILIAGLVYFALLWVNENYISEERVTWEDFISHPVEESGANNLISIEPTQLLPVGAVEAATPEELFSGIQLIGVTASVDLSNPAKVQQQITAAWQQFSKANDLHNAISWDAGSNRAYAYYYDFNSDFSSATLLVGYEKSDKISGYVSVQVHSGRVDTFKHGSDGLLPNAVWDAAYPNGVILESYDIDTSGIPSNGKAIVIQ